MIYRNLQETKKNDTNKTKWHQITKMNGPCDLGFLKLLNDLPQTLHFINVSSFQVNYQY